MTEVDELLDLAPLVSEGSTISITVSKGNTYISYEGHKDDLPEFFVEAVKEAISE